MSLRGGVIAVLTAGSLLALGVGLTHGARPWLIVALYCTVGVAAILIERGRYRPVLTAAAFVMTGERYEDPVSGRRIDVYLDPATGERDYRPEPAR